VARFSTPIILRTCCNLLCGRPICRFAVLVIKESEQESKSKKTITIPDKRAGQRKIVSGNGRIIFEAEYYITGVRNVLKGSLFFFIFLPKCWSFNFISKNIY
jgi:hypothetical protein